MREIRFRAFNQKTKKMFYVDWFMPLVIGDESKWTIHNDANTLEPKEVASDCDSELMQYTGLKDKNGKEIYEGDVVRVEWDDFDDDIYVCEWDDDFAGFEFSDRDEHMEAFLGGAQYKNIEMIGNIYENPELLNKRGGYQGNP